jgi:hypothetical protein
MPIFILQRDGKFGSTGALEKGSMGSPSIPQSMGLNRNKINTHRTGSLEELSAPALLSEGDTARPS